MKKIYLILGIIVIIILIVLGFIVFGPPNNRKNDNFQNEKKIEFFYEKIPGSKNHDPDGTWWGYNQNKICRYKDYVFMYVINNNDDDPATPSKFTIYKKYQDQEWKKGAELPTSRPGNILIDSKGVLHAFVFEALNMLENDSLGLLKHYWFPKSSSGDITNYQQEIVVNSNGKNETINIRTGAAIGQDDTMAIAFGLTNQNIYNNEQTEHLYYKKPNDNVWQHLIAGTNLKHDWYYPFVLVSKNLFHILPIQDDYVESSQNYSEKNLNIYQMIKYFKGNKTGWDQEIIADLSNHELADKKPQLLEQSEFYQDSNGKIHIIYKKLLNPDNYNVSEFIHMIKNGEKWDTETLNYENRYINWLKFVEINNQLYYIAVSSNELYISKYESDQLYSLEIPDNARGIYPYISTIKSGTNPSENYIDMLLLSGDFRDYSSSSNYYIRIPKEEFEKL